MNQKSESANSHFVKLPTTLYNGRNDRPKLNSLERDIYAYLSNWTKGGSGKYNYESTKQIARILGASNKPVLKAMHRLKALGLINWYAFPHGIGVKHLRFVPPAGLEKWHGSEPINEPTAAELAAAAEFTSVESLLRNVCEKPNTLGAKIWRACCEYCGVNSDQVKPAKQKAKAPAIETVPAYEAESEQPTQAVKVTEGTNASGWHSIEFQNAWQEWKRHRKASGRPLRAEAEQIALEQLRKEAQDEADAIHAIKSAISGGFISIKPEIARIKASGNTQAVRPVNAWDWLQKRFTELKRQPETDEEVKEWLTEFRAANPDAPAFVIWDKRDRVWQRPNNPQSEAAAAGITGRYARILGGFETLRQHIDGDSFQGQIMDRLKAQDEIKKAVENARKKQAAKIEEDFKNEVEKRGGRLDLAPWEETEKDRQILESVREILPENYLDCEQRFPSKFLDLKGEERNIQMATREKFGNVRASFL